MKKESLFYTTMTSPEKEHIRRTALWMFGLTLIGGLVMTKLTPVWDELCAQDEVEMLIMGSLLTVAAVPFHLLAGSRRMKKRKWRRIFYTAAVFNLLALSLYEAAYYTRVGIAPLDSDRLTTAAGLPLAFTILCMACFYLFIAARRLLALIFGGVGLTGVVICIVLWAREGHTEASVLWSFMFFTLVGVLFVLAAFVFAAEEISMMYDGEVEDTDPTAANITEEIPSETVPDASAARSDRETDRRAEASWGWMRFLSYASFGIFVVLGGAVVLLLIWIAGACGCRDCDGCDCFDCGNGCVGGSPAKEGDRRRKRR